MNLSEPTYLPSTEVVGANVVIFAIFDFISGTFIILANGFLLITIYRDPCRCLRTPYVFLIANLSVADFFVGVLSFLRGAELTNLYTVVWGTCSFWIWLNILSELFRFSPLFPLSWRCRTNVTWQWSNLSNIHIKSLTKKPRLLSQ